jgi:hypothetical protein
MYVLKNPCSRSSLVFAFALAALTFSMGCRQGGTKILPIGGSKIVIVGGSCTVRSKIGFYDEQPNRLIIKETRHQVKGQIDVNKTGFGPNLDGLKWSLQIDTLTVQTNDGKSIEASSNNGLKPVPDDPIDGEGSEVNNAATPTTVTLTVGTTVYPPVKCPLTESCRITIPYKN